VEATVVSGVETRVESDRRGGSPALELRMLGPLTIRRHGVMLALPASRKVRGLLAWLSLAPRAVGRSQLCELLWDVPNDPRGELRWCLSKIRGLVDEPPRRRVETQGDSVRIDLSDCTVDAVEVARAEQHLETMTPAQLQTLEALHAGDFLDGLEIDRSPAFEAWLMAQRRRFRGLHVALLERLAASVAEDEALGHLEKWAALTPFDLRPHMLLLEALAPARPDPRRRGASGGDRPSARGRGGRPCTPARRLAISQSRGSQRAGRWRRCSRNDGPERRRRLEHHCGAPGFDRGDAVRRPVRSDIGARRRGRRARP
jgi:DNA-binding SARP family transcriptional activator